jgi:hypothetical protein
VADRLDNAAKQFADELSDTFHAVFGRATPRFVAVRAPTTRRRQQQTRVVVRTEHNGPIEMSIDGRLALEFVLDFRCQWDHRQTYLAVQKASWSVRPAGIAEPLFRYEFEGGMNSPLPCAHLHVHAHRDEFVFQLFRANRGRPKSRAAAVEGTTDRALPRLSNLHFPLGGPRMRPCVEDLLQFLVEELGVDAEPNHQVALDEGRARWRRRQIAASVRDAPEGAARVLREMQYIVEPPASGVPPERLDKLVMP